jgi:hypothetical protein
MSEGNEAAVWHSLAGIDATEAASYANNALSIAAVGLKLSAPSAHAGSSS